MGKIKKCQQSGWNSSKIFFFFLPCTFQDMRNDIMLSSQEQRREEHGSHEKQIRQMASGQHAFYSLM